MASPVPAKSQPLHNFSLPYLKWKKNHTNNHQRGRSRLADSSSPHQSPPSASRRSPMSDSPAAGPRQSPMFDSAASSPQQQPPRRGLQSPMRDSSAPRLSSPTGDSTSDSDCAGGGVGGGYVIYENRKNSYPDGVKTGLLGTNSDRLIEKLEKNLSVKDGGDLSIGKESRSKIYIRLRKNNNNKHDDVQEEEKEEKVDELIEDGKAEAMDVEAEESVPKTWNLRPRKPIKKLPSVNGGGASKVESKAHQLQRAAQIRPESDGNTAEKKEKKQKFSISLLREEIEEDIFALTGSKTPRRPKKRAKSVQKQLDNLFPGMWLGMISADSYKVSDNPSKV